MKKSSGVNTLDEAEADKLFEKNLKMKRQRSAATTEKKPSSRIAADLDAGLTPEKADRPPSVGILRAKGERRQNGAIEMKTKPYNPEGNPSGEEEAKNDRDG
jgi:hypothetical protein